MHCHRTGSFPSYTPPPPPFSSPHPLMLLLGLHPINAAPISINSNEAGSVVLVIPNNATLPLPRHHTLAKDGQDAMQDGQEEEWTDRQADRHVAM